METEAILKNRAIPRCAQPVVNRIKESGEDILFAIVGDLKRNGRYSETALFFTKTKV